MRGQTGISAIILVIAFILVGVIVAILILQTANSLRSQAVNTQRQASEQMSTSAQILEILGCTKGVGEKHVYLLAIRVKPGLGSESIDLRNAVLRYIGKTSRFAKYAPVGGGTLSACDAEITSLQDDLGIYALCSLFSAVAPRKEDDTFDDTRFTVIWENCGMHSDVYAIYDDQVAYIIYPLPEPLKANERATIEITLSSGWSVPYEIRIPPGLDRNLVQIFP